MSNIIDFSSARKNKTSLSIKAKALAVADDMAYNDVRYGGCIAHVDGAISAGAMLLAVVASGDNALLLDTASWLREEHREFLDSIVEVLYDRMSGAK